MAHSRRINRLSTWAGLIVLLLLAPALLAGCGEDEAGGGGKGGVVAGAGTSGSADDKTSPDPASDEAEDEEEAEDEKEGGLQGSQAEPEPAEEPAATGGACVVGAWSLDNREFGAMLGRAGLPAGASVKASGKAVTTFSPDGSGTVEYRKWQFTTTMDGQKAVVTRTGKDTFDYTATDDGKLTIAEKQINSKVVTEVMGMKMGPQGHSPETTTATYDCEGDLLKVTSQGETSLMHREK